MHINFSFLNRTFKPSLQYVLLLQQGEGKQGEKLFLIVMHSFPDTLTPVWQGGSGREDMAFKRALSPSPPSFPEQGGDSLVQWLPKQALCYAVPLLSTCRGKQPPWKASATLFATHSLGCPTQGWVSRSCVHYSVFARASGYCCQGLDFPLLPSWLHWGKPSKWGSPTPTRTLASLHSTVLLVHKVGTGGKFPASLWQELYANLTSIKCSVPTFPREKNI